MSCYRRYTCDVLKNVDKELLNKAMRELGCELDWNVNKITWRHGNDGDTVDAAFSDNHLGIIMNGDEEGHLKVVGDFWMTGLKEKTFVDNLAQQYQKHNVIQQIEQSGYLVESTEQNQAGEIEIMAYCF